MGLWGIWALAWLVACEPPAVVQTVTVPLVHDGIDRPVTFHLPAETEGAPLLLVLHGYGGSGADMRYWSKLDSLGVAAGFVVAFPDGTQDFQRMLHWNANLSWSNRDDLGHLDQIVNAAHQRLAIDRDQVFVCGFSNGGFMAYACACDRPTRFRAVGSVGGTMSLNTWASCPESSASVPVIQLAGLQDKTIPFDGRPGHPQFSGAAAIPSIFDSLAVRFDRTNAGGTALTLQVDTLTAFHPGWGEVVRTQYLTETSTPQFSLVTYERGPHTWFEGASELLLAFFQDQTAQ